MNQMIDYAWRIKREIINTLIINTSYNSVLDIGCEKGIQLNSYIKEGEGYGLDILNLRKITKNEDNIQFIRGDALNLPFKDESFDLITATEIIEHLPNHNQFLSEVNRILIQNGSLVLSTPNQLRFTALLGQIKKVETKQYSHIDGVEGKQYGHISEITPMKLRKELKNNKFEIETIEYGTFNPSIFPFDKSFRIYKLADKMTNSKLLKPITKWDMIIKAKKKI